MNEKVVCCICGEEVLREDTREFFEDLKKKKGYICTDCLEDALDARTCDVCEACNRVYSYDYLLATLDHWICLNCGALCRICKLGMPLDELNEDVCSECEYLSQHGLSEFIRNANI